MGVRNVGRNRRRSLITGAMIALAVVAVVFFKAYALGIERVLVNMAVEGLTGALQVQRGGYFESQDSGPLDLDLPQDTGLLEKVRSVPNVRAVSPRLLFTGLINNGDTSNMFVGLGVDPLTEPTVCASGPGLTGLDAKGTGFNQLVAGEPLSKPDEDAVMLTDALAKSLKVKVGDSLVLLARTKAGSMDSVDLTVKGIFQFSDPLGNKQFGVLPLKVAQRLLHMTDRATAFGVSVIDRSALETTAQSIRETLANEEPKSAVFVWSTLAPYYRDVVILQDGMLNIVSFVVLVLVLAGIVNTMMMSTFERKREIGTLMSMGFRRWAIVVLFVIEAIWLAVISGLVGMAVGVGIVELTHLTGIPFAIPGGGSILTFPDWRYQTLGLAIVGAVITALLAALVPSYRASRLRPIDALRSD